MTLDSIIKSDEQHRMHQEPQIYARIPFKLREKQKVDQILLLRDQEQEGDNSNELLYIKIQDKLYCFDLCYRKKISVGSLYHDFDPSFFHILQNGKKFVGLKHSKIDDI